MANSLVAATSSSRFVVPNYWRDPNSGIGYQVQVEIPHGPHEFGQGRGTGPKSSGPKTGQQLFLQDVAQIREGIVPGEYDRYNMKRLVSITANIEGEDLGRVASQIAEAIRGGRRAAARRRGRCPRPDRADAADVRRLAGGKSSRA